MNKIKINDIVRLTNGKEAIVLAIYDNANIFLVQILGKDLLSCDFHIIKKDEIRPKRLIKAFKEFD